MARCSACQEEITAAGCACTHSRIVGGTYGGYFKPCAPAPKGWRCPCGAGVAPWMPICPHCKPRHTDAQLDDIADKVKGA